MEQINGESNEQEEDEKEETFLSYNDDWEELEKWRFLRWPIYISKQFSGFLRHRVLNCCRREAPDFNRNVDFCFFRRAKILIFIK